MLNIKELSYGNLIKTDSNVIGVFESLNLSGQSLFISINNKSVELLPENCEGIAISPSWLDVFGLFQHNTGLAYIKIINSQEFSVFLNATDENVQVNCLDSFSRNANMSLHNFKIKYVHQLQNLFLMRFGIDLMPDVSKLSDIIGYNNHVAKIDLLIKETELKIEHTGRMWEALESPQYSTVLEDLRETHKLESFTMPALPSKTHSH